MMPARAIATPSTAATLWALAISSSPTASDARSSPWAGARAATSCVRVTTHDQPLTIVALHFNETRYPLTTVPLPEVDDPRLTRALPLLERGLQVCMHATYMDTPYYEQLMYAGDTRLEALCTHVRSADDRLPMRAIELFGGSVLPGGLIQARYPSRIPQIIPSFALVVGRHAARPGVVAGATRFRGVAHARRSRSVLEAHRSHLGPDRLCRALPGWNFLDWADGWERGVPPGGRDGVNAAFNWQLVDTLRRKAELEDWLNESRLAERDRATAQCLANALHDQLWNADRGLYTDTPDRTSFSQHPQCLAALSGGLEPDAAAKLIATTIGDDRLTPTTLYFSHYLLDAMAQTGHGMALSRQLDRWRALPESGFKTPPETPEPTRSDCHAWSSHPLFHVVASVLGVRPAAFGFARVDVRPNLSEGPDGIAHVAATVPHPRGQMRADLRLDGGRLQGLIDLPDGVRGRLIHGDQTRELSVGENRI